MTHAYHDNLPGYDSRQIWHDGCEKCEMRGMTIPYSIVLLDEARFRRAWKRAADWNKDHEDVGPVSGAERPLLDMLWKVELMLERACGLPIGELPKGS